MTDKTIGLTILEQLGGNRFRAMTGAKDFLALEGGLQFGLPYKKINKVRIQLRGDDTYRVEFMRAYKYKGYHTVKVIAEYFGIYADKLVDVFERETGLATRL